MDIKILKDMFLTIERGDYGLSWSSQEWKSGAAEHDRSVKHVSVHRQEQAYFENFVMGSDAAEFLNKVKDQVRNRQKRKSSIAESCDEHFNNMENVHGYDIKCGDIHGKEFLNYSKCCQ